MSVSTQRSFRGDHPIVGGVKLVSGFLEKSDKILMFLVTPEDTSNNQEAGELEIARYGGNNIPGAFKAVFWIAVSILIALWMGRLG